MEIKADEISKISREQIDGYRSGIDVSEIGTVVSVGDGIARVYGLERVMAGELLEFPHDVRGLALNLEEDNIGAVVLGKADDVEEGQLVTATAANSRSRPSSRSPACRSSSRRSARSARARSSAICWRSSSSR